jgi:tryptophan-rich sensory protein
MEASVSRYSTAAPAEPARAARAKRVGSALTLLIFLVVLAAIAAIEAIASSGSASGWFGSSAQVIWTPPRVVSRAIWAAVFLLLAIAGWLIWRRAGGSSVRRVRTLLVLSLALLTVWPPMYLDGYPVLGVTALWVAFALASLLVTAVVALLFSIWRAARVAALLLIPVAGWLLYITTTNFGDAVLAALS